MEDFVYILSFVFIYLLHYQLLIFHTYLCYLLLLGTGINFKCYLYKWAVSQRSMRKNIYQPKTTKREMFLDAIYEADEQTDFTEEKVTIIVSYLFLCNINNI